MTLDDPADQPPEPWFPQRLAAVRGSRMERRDFDRAGRILFRSIVEALGFDPDEVTAVWFDRFTVTVIHRSGRRDAWPKPPHNDL